MSQTVYLVRRLSWASDGEVEGAFVRAGSEDEQPGIPIRVLLTREAAEAFCREQEEKSRQLIPPGRIIEICLTDREAFIEGLRKLGLTPPELENDYLYDDTLPSWWETVAADATPEQRAGVWELLKDVRFYDVVETTLED
jgi:hypothetical protein